MIKRFLTAVALIGLVPVCGATSAFAQSGPIEGTVKLKTPEGQKPVQGALVEIYRTDVRGRWEVKTDKSGHYIYLGLPLVGRFIVVASGPGMEPTWINNVRLTQVQTVDVVANPGDGSRLTLEQVQEQIKQSMNPGARPTGPTKEQIEAAQRAQKDIDEKKKEAEALQSVFEEARVHYNQGIELKKTNNLEGALSEFEFAAKIDPAKHAEFTKLSHKANANIAETHYQLGVVAFNAKKRPEAKEHFEKAVDAIKRALQVAPGDKDPALNNDLIIYYDILTKNSKLLVEYYGAADLVDPTVAAIGQVEALDQANKKKWGVFKGDLYRAAGRSEDAVAAYKAVLAEDPNSLESLYGLGLTLVASTEREKLQQAANFLADFVAKAPPDHKDVPGAKGALEALKNEFKVEAEKPARRRRP